MQNQILQSGYHLPRAVTVEHIIFSPAGELDNRIQGHVVVMIVMRNHKTLIFLVEAGSMSDIAIANVFQGDYQFRFYLIIGKLFIFLNLGSVMRFLFFIFGDFNIGIEPRRVGITDSFMTIGEMQMPVIPVALNFYDPFRIINLFLARVLTGFRSLLSW